MGKNLKIGIIGEAPPPYGGMAVQLKYIYDGLVTNNINCFIIKSNPEIGIILKKIPIIKTIVIESVFLLNLVFKFLRADCLHILNGSFLNFYLFIVPPLLVGKLLRKRVIINYHGGGLDDFLATHHRFIVPFFRWADEIVVPSGFLKDIFRKYGIDSTIIENIVDQSKFEYIDREVFHPVYLSVRNLKPIYNISCIIRAFSRVVKQIPESKLIIAGGGEEEIKLKNMVEGLGLAASIEFIGRIDNDKLPGIFNQASFLVNASDFDNMPVSIIEAFQAGLPVISTNPGGIPYMVTHRETGLLSEINDDEKMADHMLFLMKDQQFARQIARNAKKTVSVYCWEQVQDKWLMAYGIIDK